MNESMVWQGSGIRGVARNRAGDLIAGVELGGTKCVATLATADGAAVEQVTVATTDPDATLDALAAVLDSWWGDTGFASLGIASFGPLSLDPAAPDHGCVTTTSKPGWQGADVLGRLAGRFAVPSAFDTDVNGAALAEGRWGAARGLSDFAYVTVGTGVGVGLIVNGRPTRGFAHCELGHLRVARPAGAHWSGSCPYHGDCVEGLASGTAVGAHLAALANGAPAAAPGPEHPVWDTVVDALAQLCQAMVLAAAPRRILVGGGVANGQPHLLPRIADRLQELLAGYAILPDGGRDYLTAPGLGDRAGPLGAIALAMPVALTPND